MRPLERDDVDGLLDDADDRAVAPRIGADGAELVLGQVAAVAAEAHALLHLGDRVGERERLVLRHREQVERQALGGAGADPGQAGQLRDEVVDGGAQHGGEVTEGCSLYSVSDVPAANSAASDTRSSRRSTISTNARAAGESGASERAMKANVS